MAQDWSLFGRVLSCVVGLARQAVWTFAKRLAVSLVMAVAVSTSCALLVEFVTLSQCTVSTPVLATMGSVLAICYLAAGVLWAVHRSYHAAVERIVPLFVEQSTELLRDAIGPVLSRCPLHSHRIAIVDARNTLRELFDENTSTEKTRSLRLRLFQWLPRRITRRWLRKEFRLANDALDSLEQKDEKFVTAVTLNEFLLEKMMGGVAEIARGHVRSFALASAVIAFLLVLTPTVFMQLVLA